MKYVCIGSTQDFIFSGYGLKIPVMFSLALQIFHGLLFSDSNSTSKATGLKMMLRVCFLVCVRGRGWSLISMSRAITFHITKNINKAML